MQSAADEAISKINSVELETELRFIRDQMNEERSKREYQAEEHNRL